MDPTLLAILSIFGGAGLTVAAGFVGAGIQARQEHAKWLRERRYEVYAEFVVYMDRAEDLLGQFESDAQLSPELSAKSAELSAQRAAALAPLAVVGPKSVTDAAKIYVETLRTNRRNANADALEPARDRYLQAMRSALSIDI